MTADPTPSSASWTHSITAATTPPASPTSAGGNSRAATSQNRNPRPSVATFVAMSASEFASMASARRRPAGTAGTVGPGDPAGTASGARRAIGCSVMCGAGPSRRS